MRRFLPLSLLLSSVALAAPVTFVKTYSDGAEVVQWVEQGGQLSGTWQIVYLSGQPASLKSSNQTFTGTRSGNTVNLKLTTTLLGSIDTKIWSGTLAGQTLTLNRPAQTGISQTVFTKSSVEAYNKAVAQLSTVGQQQQQAAREQAQAAAAQQARIQEQNRMVNQVNSAASEALSQAGNLLADLQGDVTEIEDVIRLYQQNLDELRQDHQTLMQDAASAKDCYDVGQVQGYDLGQLTGYDMGQLTGYTAGEFSRTKGDVERHIQQAAQLQSTLKTGVKNLGRLPGLTPLATLKASVNPLQLEQAGEALAKAVTGATTALDHLNQVRQSTLSTANTLVEEARKTAGGLTCQK